MVCVDGWEVERVVRGGLGGDGMFLYMEPIQVIGTWQMKKITRGWTGMACSLLYTGLSSRRSLG